MADDPQGADVALPEITVPAAGTSGGALSKNQNYLVTVARGATSRPGHAPGSNMVTANALAKLNLQIDNHWVNILEALGLQGGGGGSEGLAGAAVGFARSAVSAAQIFSGNTFLPEVFTSHVWRGSTGLTLALQMRFDAWDDAAQDVLLPCQRLISWFCPIRGNQGQGDTSTFGSLLQYLNQQTGSSAGTTAGSYFLHPPGPTVYEYLKNDKSHMFVVQLGMTMAIVDLIPTSIAWEFEDRFDKNGNPMSALMNIGFITYTIPDANEVLAYFINAQVTSPGAMGLQQ